MPRLRIDTVALAVLALLLVLVVKYWPVSGPMKARELEQIMRSGELIVLTQNNPTTYYLDRDGNKAGAEYKLVKAFAKSLGLSVKIEVKSSVKELLDAIEAGEGDLGSAGLSITEERESRFLFSRTYQLVSQQVVCRRGGVKPRRAADLQEVDLAVIAGSSYEERLSSFQVHYPNLTWQATEGVGAERLLEMVWLREVDCTVMDSNIVAINQRYYPELKVRFELGNKDKLAWVLPMGAESLQNAVNEWLNSYEASKKIASVQEQYYGHVELFDYVDTAAFIRRIKNRYSSYQPYFQNAAQTYDISESLLAAQAYQESHWNPVARSPTGVRGIMMLTMTTAKAMGVESRLDAEQSIMGGAKYLAKLRAKLSEKIEEPDLTWFALAAYNVGLGHLRDAQALVKHAGDDPYRWHYVKEALPLLSDPSYYKFLRYGYARGSEPVRYVQQIRQYEEIMAQHLLALDEQIRKEQAILADELTTLKNFVL